MSVELKIKSKHLALEPAIIRREERKLLKQLAWLRSYGMEAVLNDPAFQSMNSKYESLHNHRKWNVRNEARATELARAYIAGKPYASVEKKRKLANECKFVRYIIPRIAAMVQKYGDGKTVTNSTILDWCELDRELT